MADVFDRLGSALEGLPKELDEAYREATRTELIKAGNTFRDTLRATSGSEKLNAQMSTEIVISGDHYSYNITWDDTTIVNVAEGKGYGRDADKPRERGKRNYSIRPATYHDLAYIINQGHDGIMGTRFIYRARNKIKAWRKKRDALYRAKESVIAKKFE